MNKIRSALNWAGSKYKYVDIINELLGFLEKYNGSFIYFNFISKYENVNQNLTDFIKKKRPKIIQLRNKVTTGQKRIGTSKVNEVILTNI